MVHPIYADFSITSNCNLNCSFCYASLKNRSKRNLLSINEIEDLFNDLERLGIMRIGIEGGEPFMRNDFFEILKLADTHNFTYFINSNGTLINKDIAYALSKTKVTKVCVSIDGPCATIHEKSRGSIGCFEKTINGVKNLLEEGVRTDGILTLNGYNKDCVLETLQFMKSIGLKRAAIMILGAVGDARDMSQPCHISREEYEKVIVMLSEYKKNERLPLDTTIVPLGEGMLPWELYLPLKNAGKEEYFDLWGYGNKYSTLTETDFGCTAGKDNLYIDECGNVFGCSMMSSRKEFIAGNIRTDNLENIWNNSSLLNKLRSMNLNEVEGQCKECELIHECKAGCRACAFERTSSLLGSDIRCKGVIENWK